MWNLKTVMQMNAFTKQKQTHRHGKHTYGYQKGKGMEGKIRSLGLTDTLLYIKQINNNDPLYSTGNYIQYLLITYNGEESEKEECVYV